MRLAGPAIDELGSKRAAHRAAVDHNHALLHRVADANRLVKGYGRDLDAALIRLDRCSALVHTLRGGGLLRERTRSVDDAQHVCLDQHLGQA